MIKKITQNWLPALLICLSLYSNFLIGFFIRGAWAISQGKWALASICGQRIIFLTNWLQPVCGQCQQKWLIGMPLIGLRHGGQFLAVSEGFLISGQKVFQGVIQDRPAAIAKEWPVFREKSQTLLNQASYFQNLKLPFFKDLDISLLEKSLVLLPDLISLYQAELKKYTFLLQNDRELRPTGGFMGSYAQFEFQRGGLVNYMVEDIYVPDGAIKGHIEPPEPIQKAFQQGNWRLPNSNWEPHFPQAAETINWFFKKAGVESGQGLVALNLGVIEGVLEIIGPVYLPDYELTVNPENFYLLAQAEVEAGFFPGSTQKKDFLNYLASHLFLKIEGLDLSQLLTIGRWLYQQAASRNIQVYCQNPELKSFFTQLGWSGRIEWPFLTGVNDYLLIVDANLGANKANVAVSREVNQQVKEKEKGYQVSLAVKYVNQNPFARPRPPEHWGGDYENYLRIYLPIEAQIQSVFIADELLDKGAVQRELKPAQKVQSVGFFVQAAHGQTKEAKINYFLPKKENKEKYSLFVQKQSGISYSQQVNFCSLNDFCRQKQYWLEKDQLILF